MKVFTDMLGSTWWTQIAVLDQSMPHGDVGLGLFLKKMQSMQIRPLCLPSMNKHFCVHTCESVDASSSFTCSVVISWVILGRAPSESMRCASICRARGVKAKACSQFRWAVNLWIWGVVECCRIISSKQVQGHQIPRAVQPLLLKPSPHCH